MTWQKAAGCDVGTPSDLRSAAMWTDPRAACPHTTPAPSLSPMTKSLSSPLALFSATWANVAVMSAWIHDFIECHIFRVSKAGQCA